ncbi:MAG: hypothetical protein ACOC0A_00625, partial [Planctomycetota bacterium]
MLNIRKSVVALCALGPFFLMGCVVSRGRYRRDLRHKTEQLDAVQSSLVEKKTDLAQTKDKLEKTSDELGEASEKIEDLKGRLDE